VFEVKQAVNDPAERITPEIPDFDLIRPVGRGGFGEVWLAVNRTTGQLRAVKIVALQQPGQVGAAAREISSLTRLEGNLRCRHENLLNIHHVGQTASHLFYVMDPADDRTGGPAANSDEYQPATLQSRLQDGPLPTEVCFEYARQLLAGLASLHAAGMAHRDVKPANCLFVGGKVKLADFGLLTESHPLVSRVGTQKYMPPDGRMDIRADVYAAGLVIYEMLSGLPVDEFPRLGSRSREIAADATLASLLRLVLRACEREPERRFTDARAMLAELDSPAKKPRRSRRSRVALTAVAMMLIAGGLIWMFGLGRELARPTGVGVSFVTFPYEARIYVDGALLVDSANMPYTTPCTVDDLPATDHEVAFECDGHPRWDAGRYDFAQTRQIVSRRP
jgi:eukaryotic-like serine/threonine-protein kinase